MLREYLASVKGVDRNIGRILKLLDELDLTNNTIIIFTSDQGYLMGHNGLWHKGTGWFATMDGRDPSGLYKNFLTHYGFTQRHNLYDWSIRVPAIICWPGIIQPGTHIHQTISFIDWFPSLLEMAKVNILPDIKHHGRSIVPLLSGQHPNNWDNDLFAQHRKMRTYRTNEWKYIRDFGTTNINELYNLREDPDERDNLLLNLHTRDPKISEIRNKMNTKMENYMKSINDPLLDE